MHGVTMMNAVEGAKIHKMARESIAQLAQILNVAKGICDDSEYEQLKRGIGLAIGSIQMEVLEPINVRFPELDDLK